MAELKQPTRSEVAELDTWDLASLFAGDAEWREGLDELESAIEGYEQFRGRLSESADALAECLEFDLALDRKFERVGVYAFLRTTEDQTDSTAQEMMGRYQNIATKASQNASFIRPEIMAIDDDTMAGFLASERLADLKKMVERMLRYKKHTLGSKEEELIAMQGEMAQAANQSFRQLLDADMKFGNVTDDEGNEVELSHASFMQLLHSPSREVRKTAFHQYYEQITGHENTLTATFNGSVQKDVYYARVRGYDGALANALFPDNVPQSVYDNLIQSVRDNLPNTHRYFDVRRRKMGIDDIHHYDTYVPILSDQEQHHSWDEGVQLVMDSLQILGSDYCDALRAGLSGRWCDRYPNQGKQSGAFSCGTFDGDPYILMNYKPEVLEDVFTLAHEAGHSMHSYYSAGNQPYQYYDYTIFVAEVASTFNEQLLCKHLVQNATSDAERAFLINREIDGIRGTIIRQTMFAEFEKITHEMAEQGEPLTTDALKKVYRELLEAYFGENFAIDDELSLECLRIPHFYRAFYVYKYATGLSAAIALSQRVVNGGEQELQDYLSFLKGGCSKDPLDLLRDAGVDMASPEPVNTALARFADLVDQLDELIPDA